MNAENTQKDQGADEVVPYEKMHWATLKKLVTDAGEEWVDPKTAADFLNARDGNAESSDDSKVDGTDEAADQSSDDDTGDQSQKDPAESTDESAPGDPTSDAPPPADSEGDDLIVDQDQAADDDVVTGDDLVNTPVDDEADKDPCFDEKAPHGVISGVTNARYWQNGCHFDSQKKYLAPEDVE